MSQVAFAPDVFTWPSDDPQIDRRSVLGMRVDHLPHARLVRRCGSTGVEAHLLPRRGTLWTFTTQGFLPKEPYASGETNETFVPYGMGIVQLGDEVRVESRLTTADLDVLHIGMEMEFVVVPFRTDDDGTMVMTYTFAPAKSQPAATEGSD